VGESATFTCELSHPGVKNVQWWLDGSPLHNNFVTEISEQDGIIHTLTLNDVACHDSGTVTFRAGSLISSAKLLVKGISLLERQRWPPLELLSVQVLLHSWLPLLNVSTSSLWHDSPAALLQQGSHTHSRRLVGTAASMLQWLRWGRVAGIGLLLVLDISIELNQYRRRNCAFTSVVVPEFFHLPSTFFLIIPQLNKTRPCAHMLMASELTLETRWYMTLLHHNGKVGHVCWLPEC